MTHDCDRSCNIWRSCIKFLGILRGKKSSLTYEWFLMDLLICLICFLLGTTDDNIWVMQMLQSYYTLEQEHKNNIKSTQRSLSTMLFSAITNYKSLRKHGNWKVVLVSETPWAFKYLLINLSWICLIPFLIYSDFKEHHWLQHQRKTTEWNKLHLPQDCSSCFNC